jgi:type IV pilus assembly protein PilY1
VLNRTPVIYVGANDGMLHAFSGATGRELFAYIPRGVYNNLLALTDRYYAGNHKFFVDGSPSVGDVYYGSAWHTVLAGGENAGGNSIYAIDVTSPASLTTETALSSAILWDFTDSNMGLSYSRPAVVNTNAGAVVIFGNGYNSSAETPYFYALNAKTGAVLAKINLCAQVTGICSSSLANGLSSVTVTNADGNLSASATLAYAGDLQGNLWRIDMSNSNPAQWTVSVLFQARDANGNIQPITTAPATTLNPNYPRMVGEMVYVGTGQMLTIADLSTTGLRSIYGIYDNNSTAGLPIPRDSLVQQTLSNTTVTLTAGGTVPGRTVTSNAVSLTAKRGWDVDLSLVSGERDVTEPQVDSGALIVTTNQPTGNVCTGGMNAWLNLFNFSTGGGFPTPPLSNTTQLIEGLSLGQVFAAAPRVEIFAHSNTTRAILVTESGQGVNNVPIQSFNMYGRALHRTSWTELR